MRIFLALILALGWVRPSLAEDAQRVTKLEAEVQELKRIVADLQAALDGPGPAPSGEASPPVGEAKDWAPSVRVGGFAHVQYGYAREQAATGVRSTNNFTLGGVDLFLSSQLSERWSFLSEILFEYEEDGENVLDVERMLLKYDYASWLQFSAGRGHVPLGYWNQRYHHGTYFQTTIQRPLIYGFEDEGGVLPIHYVGMELGGDIESGAGWLRYGLNVGNGRGRTPGAIQLIEDRNDSKMLNLILTWFPTGDEGVGLGAVVLHDRIPPNRSLGRMRGMDETIAGFHAFYQQEPLELLLEGFWIDHRDEQAGRHRESFGGYAQLSYSVGRYRPYYRFDLLRAADADPFFGGLVEDTDQHILGLRFDLNKFVASKFEYRRVRREASDANEAAAQLSFAF